MEHSDGTAAVLPWDDTEVVPATATAPAATPPPDDSTTLLSDMAAFSWDELASSDPQDAFGHVVKTGACSLCDAGLCAGHDTNSIAVPQPLVAQAPELAAVQQHATLLVAASTSRNQQPRHSVMSAHQGRGRKRVRRRSGNKEGWLQQDKAGHADDGEWLASTPLLVRLSVLPGAAWWRVVLSS